MAKPLPDDKAGLLDSMSLALTLETCLFNEETLAVQPWYAPAIASDFDHAAGNGLHHQESVARISTDATST